jgi:hypothetical protein
MSPRRFFYFAAITESRPPRPPSLLAQRGGLSRYRAAFLRAKEKDKNALRAFF